MTDSNYNIYLIYLLILSLIESLDQPWDENLKYLVDTNITLNVKGKESICLFIKNIFISILSYNFGNIALGTTMLVHFAIKCQFLNTINPQLEVDL